MGILGLPLGSLGTKWHLGASSVARHKVYYKGEGASFPQVRAIIFSPILELQHVLLPPKCCEPKSLSLIPCSFIVFTSDLHLSLLRSLGTCEMQFGDWTIQMQTYFSPLNLKNWTHHAIQLYTIIISFYNVNPNNWKYETLFLMNYSMSSPKHHTLVACCFLHSLFLPWELHAHIHCLHMVIKPHLSQSWYFFF